MRKLALTMVLLSLCCQGQPGNVDDPDLALIEKAEKLAQETIIIDTHIDVPYRLTRKEGDIEKICSGNLLRVWMEVEEVAAGG